MVPVNLMPIRASFGVDNYQAASHHILDGRPLYGKRVSRTGTSFIRNDIIVIKWSLDDWMDLLTYANILPIPRVI